ncbi:hypothetical protein EHH44_19370 [Mycolicibacter terrae]|uniref:Uncharacterized protein n=1 Tax=Mycolicibacter terrae TaxID=1788 RepID=A0ACD2EID8_9MYCO|nr:hypothetical protein [Mycolicibacter terrae]RRR41073.1 hypothetical protein EHH44_19370 [Mycolicibacter terrae]
MPFGLTSWQVSDVPQMRNVNYLAGNSRNDVVAPPLRDQPRGGIAVLEKSAGSKFAGRLTAGGGTHTGGTAKTVAAGAFQPALANQPTGRLRWSAKKITELHKRSIDCLSGFQNPACGADSQKITRQISDDIAGERPDRRSDWR